MDRRMPLFRGIAAGAAAVALGAAMVSVASPADAATHHKPDHVMVHGGYHCPKGYSIKGNISRNGHIYHMPGQRFYTRTKPEECFTTQAAARHAGFRKSKV